MMVGYFIGWSYDDVVILFEIWTPTFGIQETVRYGDSVPKSFFWKGSGNNEGGGASVGWGKG